MCSQPPEFRVSDTYNSTQGNANGAAPPLTRLPTLSCQVRCYKCNRKLADGISGSDYRLKFTCPKCKCSFAITPNGIQPISIGKF